MKIKKFNEANIKIKELDEPSKDGKLRGDTLVKKIKDHDKINFKPKDGSDDASVVVKNDKEIVKKITDKNGRYDPNKASKFFLRGIRYDNVIVGDNDQLYQLNDIEKTSDFNGGGGSSLGTKSTREVECIQCLFLALRQTNGDSITIESVGELYDDKGNIKQELISQIRTPIEVTRDLINIYLGNWINTFIDTANALYEIRPIFTEKKSLLDDNVLSRRKSYIFYQIGYSSELTKTIGEKFRSFDSTKGIPISKWTPSDIWAISKQSHRIIISNIEECNTIEELNNKIDTLFDQKSLRGISLKKLSKREKIKLVLNKVTPVPNFEFDMVVTSKNALASLGVKVIVKQISSIESENKLQAMYFRTCAGETKIGDISGEIMGESARHGKVGLTVINKNIDIIETELGIKIGKIETKNELSSKTDSFLTSEIERLNKFISERGKSVGVRSSKTNKARLISKYQALKFAELLYNTDKKISDMIVQRIFYYAMAIRNDAFESPKYVRII